MEHKLTFTLGDPSWDGHGLTSVYYIICNHSGQEIEAAYKEMCKKLGFDFLELFDEYECGYMISEEHTTALLENGIIEPDRVITEETLVIVLTMMRKTLELWNSTERMSS